MIPLIAAAIAQSPAPVSALPTNERLDAAAARCLAHWKEHPFGPAPSYRTLSPSVRVLGLGSRETTEDLTTDVPELVVVDASVNVLTKTTFILKNPNGWYCFAENVGVLSKIVFDAHCSANLADSRTGALVMGRSSTNGGVVVLGDVEVRRTCSATP